MAAKPTISPGRLRKAIREVCNMAPLFPKTETLLADGIREMLRVDVPVEQLREGIEWNLTEEYLRRHENKDTDEVEFFITQTGIAKEAQA